LSGGVHIYAALCLKACLAGRSRYEAQGSATSSGWGTQIRWRTPTYPTSWFCPLSQLARIKRSLEDHSISCHPADLLLKSGSPLKSKCA